MHTLTHTHMMEYIPDMRIESTLMQYCNTNPVAVLYSSNLLTLKTQLAQEEKL